MNNTQNTAVTLLKWKCSMRLDVGISVILSLKLVFSNESFSTIILSRFKVFI